MRRAKEAAPTVGAIGAAKRNQLEFRPQCSTRLAGVQAAVRFDATPGESKLIDQIVERAAALYAEHGEAFDKKSFAMDVTAVHCNGLRLRLRAFLKASDFDFSHDVAGIINCIDRTTGKLTKRFLPRFARRVRRRGRARG